MRGAQLAVPFQETFDSAMSKYAPERWHSMPSKELTAIIYREMRRMDAEAIFGKDQTQNMQVASKVMIVEDDIMMADMCEGMLIHVGYKVCGIARTVGEALALATREEPDLALIDVRLDGEFGTDIVPQLRGLSRLGILYSTGSPTTAMLNGVEGDACLAKPYEAADLVRALEIVSEMVTAGTASPPFPRNFQVLPSAFTTERERERRAP